MRANVSVFFKPASTPDTRGLNFFDWHLQGLLQVEPVLENLCMTLACTVTLFQGVPI